MSEIRIHHSLKHPNVVSFDHFFEDNECIYILLEMCSNRTLHELVARRKRLGELEARCYLVQIIAGLKYIHANHIIHRDLKLRNFFLTDKMELKIGDFGLAARLKYPGERRKTVCGTPNYMAPEIIFGHGHAYEVDVWALGVTLYVLLFGRPPFEASDASSVYARVQAAAYSFPSEVSVSPEAKDLVSLILCPDPNKRPTLDQILEHKFVADYKVPKLMPISTLVCPPSDSFTKQYAAFYSPSKAELKPVPAKRCQSSLALAQSGGSPLSEFEVHVKNWVGDGKCGLVYSMSNGSAGATFNDETKLLLRCNKQ
eukprot:TRINITY_DN6441_c0_g3_i1.p1 TRINITY_DN6441_c0_g3~~TRINITY_DN6441_c0_g3_i1.p1  ORF type:complete len:313 (+),score=85.22 TRINITY_DN6441_c0_g3_i1:360-1298(+)